LLVRLFIQRWFLLSLFGVAILGFVAAEPLAPLPDNALLRNGVVVAVLFLMSFPMKFGDLRDTARRPAASMLASGLNYGMLPLVAWAASLLSTGDFALGMNIAAAAPCTMASAAVLTRRAGGNDATALMVTIVTNLICFLMMPFWLYLTTGGVIPFSILPVPGQGGIVLWEMVWKLLLLVLLPMTAGQLARLLPGWGHWAGKMKTPIGVVAQCGILTMVFLGCVRSGLKLRELETSLMPSPLDFGAMTFLVLAIHLVALGLSLWVARRLAFPRREEIPIAFAGSQKTLMIGLAVAAEFYPDQPLALLPMVAYHLGQLFIDTMVADRYRAAELRDTAVLG